MNDDFGGVKINKNTSFYWPKHNFGYLGVITPSSTQLFDTNYNTLIKLIKSNVTRCSPALY